MNLTEEIKNQIIDLYNDTPENVHSVALGYKFINNEKTDQIGIIFKVYQKKPRAELNENEILPSSISIDNQSYVTDVIEESVLPSGLECYTMNPLSSEISRLQGQPTFLNPIKGGQEIIQFPTGWTNVNGSWFRAVGTMGLIAVDNVDNKLVGLTNAHVVCDNLYVASDRIKANEINNPSNIVEEQPWPPSPSTSYRPGSLSNNGSNLFLSGPRIKRYSALYKNSGNTIDCALLFLSNGVVTNQSFGIHKPSTLPQMTSRPPFATRDELNNLTWNNRLYSTGRTTGPKGWGETSSCRLRPISIGASRSIGFDQDVITFNNTIEYCYEDFSSFPSAGGDSGSAVLAEINGQLKIIGLLFAGGSNNAILCRIDEIADKMNVRAWDDSYSVNNSAPCGNPYLGGSDPVPTNPVLSRIVVCDFDDPRSALPHVDINGIRYYQAGCTKNAYPSMDSFAPLTWGSLQDKTLEWDHSKKVLDNFFNLYNFKVIKRPESGLQYPYRAWFFGWSTAPSNPNLLNPPIDSNTYVNDAIFYARSNDPITGWQVYSGPGTWDSTMNPSLWVPVLYRSASTSPSAEFSSEAVGDPSVVYHNGTYYMAYSAVGSKIISGTRYFINCIMGATSTDGVSWTPTNAPLLEWENERITPYIPGDAWGGPNYYGAYHRPSLMLDGNKWKLWFDYYTPDSYKWLCLGYAENTFVNISDFKNGNLTNPPAGQSKWTVLRAGDNYLLENWPNPDVVKVGQKYYSFCDAASTGPPSNRGSNATNLGGNGRITVAAESDDGINWTKTGFLLPDGLEAANVPQSFVNEENGQTWLYLYYGWHLNYSAPVPDDWYAYKEIRCIKKRLL
jgi:hypothetical protein